MIRRQAWKALIKKIKEHTADDMLWEKLWESFEKLFHYDERDILRMWKPWDNLDDIFKNAKRVVSAAATLCHINAYLLTDTHFYLYLFEDCPYQSSSPPTQYPL
jgi:Root hair defective 3 GTP-binding protein (RHD3)